MNTRRKVMGLAALPLAGLLATGGAALAQTTGAPAGTQVVQQAVTRTAGVPCPRHAVKAAVQQPSGQQRMRDRDCGHQAQAVQPGARTTEHVRDGSCAAGADR
jgi:hypothetical protein